MHTGRPGAVLTGQYRYAVHTDNQAIRFLHGITSPFCSCSNFEIRSGISAKFATSSSSECFTCVTGLDTRLHFPVTVLHRRVNQPLADRFNHGNRNTDAQLTHGITDLHQEGGGDHDIVGEVVILVNFTCISERTYSTSTSAIGFQASRYAFSASFSIR